MQMETTMTGGLGAAKVLGRESANLLPWHRDSNGAQTTIEDSSTKTPQGSHTWERTTTRSLLYATGTRETGNAEEEEEGEDAEADQTGIERIVSQATQPTEATNTNRYRTRMEHPMYSNRDK